MFVGQDRLEHATIKRMRLPKNARGFDGLSGTVPGSGLSAWRDQLDHKRWKPSESLKQPEIHEKS